MRLSIAATLLVLAGFFSVGCGERPPAAGSQSHRMTPPAPASPAPTTPAPATPAPERPPAKAKTGELRLPEVEGLVRGKTNRFDDPRLGYSVPYNSKNGLTATIFVYSGGCADIADGLSDPVRAQFAQAKKDIVDYSNSNKGGGWLSATKQEEGEVRLGDGPDAVPALHASFTLGTTLGDALSDLYLTGNRGNFLKIRCTYSAEAKKECQEERARLLKALGAALQ